MRVVGWGGSGGGVRVGGFKWGRSVVEVRENQDGVEYGGYILTIVRIIRGSSDFNRGFKGLRVYGFKGLRV